MVKCANPGDLVHVGSGDKSCDKLGDSSGDKLVTRLVAR
jgi:hypothetical protein